MSVIAILVGTMELAVTGSMDLIAVARKDLLAIDVNFQVRNYSNN